MARCANRKSPPPVLREAAWTLKLVLHWCQSIDSGPPCRRALTHRTVSEARLTVPDHTHREHTTRLRPIPIESRSLGIRHWKAKKTWTHSPFHTPLFHQIRAITINKARTMAPPPHPLDPLSAAEITLASAICKQRFKSLHPGADVGALLFQAVSLQEPPKPELLAFTNGKAAAPPARKGFVLMQPPASVYAANEPYAIIEAVVDLGTEQADSWKLVRSKVRCSLVSAHFCTQNVCARILTSKHTYTQTHT